ncbi:acetylglutamate kinase [Runella defluvii]|uniref:Acetylglutamate kinase n=1 Tax=Runella defluvii TaxID=370973 RepID=A0A7W5ZKT8_9BACT|nr:acetylglutamate kinase [Runella defluvii]MBB3839152.1 acetylglutamate kinase [Runella defluvii]
MEKLLVIKIGGNVIDNPEALDRFLSSFASLPQHKILIHGGGKIATQVAEKLGIETLMVDGRRITDEAMLNVVTMVYGGLVNKTIVGKLQQKDSNAIGLTGADAAVIKARKRPVKEIDYGFVGDVAAVNSDQLSAFLHGGLVPIIAPLTFDPASGSMLNTNADTMASSVAVALAAQFEVNLVYCFEKKGVLSDPTNDDAVIPQIAPSAYQAYKAEGVINKGMIPKLDNAFAALQNGVAKVTICHADQLATAVNDGSAGTQLINE